MNQKVTKKIRKYPSGQEPDSIIPKENMSYRYLLGKSGENPLVVICMNPSAADEKNSDATIERIISASVKLENDGWMMFNTYPERATNANDMSDFCEELSKENVEVLKNYLTEKHVAEVWGAWGDLKHDALRRGRDEITSLLSELKIRVFHFGALTKKGNPRHPLNRQEKWEISQNSKRFL